MSTSAPFHRYRYQPDDGEVLEIAESRMNSGTYVYLVANPYMKFEQFYVPSEPPVVALSGLYAEIANDAMNGILAETERQSPDQLQLCFCYMMDLLGILTEKNAAGIFPPDPGKVEGLNKNIVNVDKASKATAVVFWGFCQPHEICCEILFLSFFNDSKTEGNARKKIESNVKILSFLNKSITAGVCPG